MFLKKTSTLSPLQFFLLLLLFSAAFLFLRRGLAVIAFPFHIDWVEGLVLDQLSSLSDLKYLYPTQEALNQGPVFMPSAYPPLTHIVLYPFYLIYGNQYWYGRLIVLISVILTGFSIGWVVKKLTSSWFSASVSGLVFFSIPFVANWSPLLRVDFLALMLSWLGIVILIGGGEAVGLKRVLSSALFCALAVFAKQSYIFVTPTTLFLWLLLSHQKKAAFYFVSFFLILTGLPLFYLNIKTDGGLFFNLITVNHVVSFDIWVLHRFFGEVLTKLGYFVGIVICFFSLKRKQPLSVFLFGAVYFSLALLSVLSLAKAGSNINYFLEFSAGVSLLAGLSFRFAKNTLLFPVVLTLLIVQTLFTTTWPINKAHPTYDGFFERDYYNQAFLSFNHQSVLDLVQQTKGKILTDDAAAGILPLAGKRIIFEPFVMKELQKNGFWDAQPLLEQIQNKEFDLIFITHYLDANHALNVQSAQGLYTEAMWWPREVYEAVVQYYKLLEVNDKSFVFARLP